MAGKGNRVPLAVVYLKISKSVVGQASIVQTANLIMITITQAATINLPKIAHDWAVFGEVINWRYAQQRPNEA